VKGGKRKDEKECKANTYGRPMLFYFVVAFAILAGLMGAGQWYSTSEQPCRLIGLIKYSIDKETAFEEFRKRD